MNILSTCATTSDLQDSRLKNFLEFFPVSKDNIIQIDLKSIKDAAERMAISKQQLDKVFKKRLVICCSCNITITYDNNSLTI